MAGIGFKLRKLSQDDSLSGLLLGYGGAAVVCVGPWMLTILALLEASFIFGGSGSLFSAQTTYCFALSLMATGGLQNLVTRYLADRLHQESRSFHSPTLVGTLVLLNPLATLLGVAVFAGGSLPLLNKLLCLALLVILCNIWLVMVMLGAARAYWKIVEAFAWGALATLGLGWGLKAGPQSALLGFTLGQGVVLACLLAVMLREFGWSRERACDFGFLDYYRKYPSLFWAGTCYYVAAWSGALFYWYGYSGAVVQAGFRSYPLHDISHFWGLLSTIPAATLFFVAVETDFYLAYRNYFRGILQDRASYAGLVQRRDQMVQVLREGAVQIFQVQGVITLLACALLPWVLSTWQLQPQWGPALRIGLLGAMGLSLAQFSLLVLYYFELYPEALQATGLLLAGGLLVNGVTLKWGPAYHGWGLAAGSLLALAWSLRALARHFRWLEYRLFGLQEMPGNFSGPPEEAFGKQVRSQGQWLVPVE